MVRVYAVDIKNVFGPAQAFGTFGELVTVIVKNAFVIAGVIAFLLLVFGAFTIIMGAGAGDTKQLERGRQAIVGAVTGLIVVVASFWIVQIVEKLTGVPLLR
ncbi:hypothetical protein HY410_01855 [Candidatus Gottesmanbacteria bacterium]|nr:hypothetical protein [Candidatus Gottesmanbacteria bacterium]